MGGMGWGNGGGQSGISRPTVTWFSVLQTAGLHACRWRAYAQKVSESEREREVVMPGKAQHRKKTLEVKGRGQFEVME